MVDEVDEAAQLLVEPRPVALEALGENVRLELVEHDEDHVPLRGDLVDLGRGFGPSHPALAVWPAHDGQQLQAEEHLRGETRASPGVRVIVRQKARGSRFDAPQRADALEADPREAQAELIEPRF